MLPESENDMYDFTEASLDDRRSPLVQFKFGRENLSVI